MMESKEVLIIGGGLVGVELAAEIASSPLDPNMKADRSVTIVHSGPYLLSRTRNIPEGARKYIHQWLENHGVTILCDSRVISAEEGSGSTAYIRTSDGKVIRGDLVFLCTGNVSPFNFLNSQL